MPSTKNVEKWKFWFVKDLICSEAFHKKLFLNALCAYLFNFLFSWSKFTFYSIYAIMACAL